MTSLDAMLPEYFPDHTLDVVTIRCVRQRPLARYDAEPGVVIVVTGKKNLEVLVCQIFGMQNTIKPVFAQQPVRSGKSSRQLRQRVLHGPWRDVH